MAGGDMHVRSGPQTYMGVKAREVFDANKKPAGDMTQAVTLSDNSRVFMTAEGAQKLNELMDLGYAAQAFDDVKPGLLWGTKPNLPAGMTEQHVGDPKAE